MKYAIGQIVYHLGEPVEIVGYAPRFQGHDDYEIKDSDGFVSIMEEDMLDFEMEETR